MVTAVIAVIGVLALLVCGYFCYANKKDNSSAGEELEMEPKVAATHRLGQYKIKEKESVSEAGAHRVTSISIDEDVVMPGAVSSAAVGSTPGQCERVEETGGLLDKTPGEAASSSSDDHGEEAFPDLTKEDSHSVHDYESMLHSQLYEFLKQTRNRRYYQRMVAEGMFVDVLLTLEESNWNEIFACEEIGMSVLARNRAIGALKSIKAAGDDTAKTSVISAPAHLSAEGYGVKAVYDEGGEGGEGLSAQPRRGDTAAAAPAASQSGIPLTTDGVPPPSFSVDTPGAPEDRETLGKPDDSGVDELY
jgi:hypothetical protein